MSADLLAEYDPHYVPPTKSNSSTTAEPPATSSAINELAFFNGPLAPHANSTPKSGPNIASNFQELQSIASSSPLAEDDFGGWGDFVAPAVSPPRTTTSSTTQKTYGDLDERFPPINQQANSRHALIRPGARVRAATQDFFSGKIKDLVADPSQLIDGPKPKLPSPLINRQTRSGAYPPDSDVLFDADNLSEEDEAEDEEFGEFENAQSPPRQSAPRKQPDLLSGEMDAVSTTMQKLFMPSLPRQNAPEERNPFAEFGSSPASPAKGVPTSPRVITPWPAYVQKSNSNTPQKKSASRRPPPTQTNWDDPLGDSALGANVSASTGDSWGWGDEPAETPKAAQKAHLVRPSTSNANLASSNGEDDAWGWDAQDDDFAASISKPPAQDSSPPTNVPPPTVLLAFIPDILMPLQSSLFSPGLKQKILAYPVVLNTLESYLSLGIVAAYIVAGRKSRWKRDKFLSQSMSIGRAGARGKSGMKLTGVDKAEAAREDREAGDLVRWWKDQVGRLRSAVVAANLTIHEHDAHLHVPEINEAMPVRTATSDEGALTAPKCCFLCGLKRDERVLKIDGQVEDSFGEWWVDHWGHRVCKDFWVEHSDKLKHR